MKSRFGLAALMATSLFPCSFGQVLKADLMDVKLSPTAKEYCHVVQFPKGWKAERLDDPAAYPGIDSRYSDHEFRVKGLLGTQFLVGAFSPNTARAGHSINHYLADLSDATTRVRPVSKAEWDAATVLPLIRKSISPKIVGYSPSFAPFQRYAMSGTQPSYPGSDSRLSPDSAWLVLQSGTPERVRRPVQYHAIFLDVFDTATGRKIVTIQGTYSEVTNVPDSNLGKTAWLTERYFIIPLGAQLEKCVVCEFSARREP
jgi:hypothetical protein